MLMEIEIERDRRGRGREGDRDRATEREGKGRVGISAPLLQILDLLRSHLRVLLSLSQSQHHSPTHSLTHYRTYGRTNTSIFLRNITTEPLPLTPFCSGHTGEGLSLCSGYCHCSSASLTRLTAPDLEREGGSSSSGKEGLFLSLPFESLGFDFGSVSC